MADRRATSSRLGVDLPAMPDISKSGKGRPGRPTKLTEQVWGTLCRAWELGLSNETAAELAGISYGTLADWLKHERFLTAVNIVKASSRDFVTARLVEQIANGSVDAMKYWLSRRTKEFRQEKAPEISPQDIADAMQRMAAQMRGSVPTEGESE